MSKKEQRRRQASTRASFLDDEWIPMVNRDYYGNAAQASKKWKRQWLRMRKFVRSRRPAYLRYCRLIAIFN